MDPFDDDNLPAPSSNKLWCACMHASMYDRHTQIHVCMHTHTHISRARSLPLSIYMYIHIYRYAHVRNAHLPCVSTYRPTHSSPTPHLHLLSQSSVQDPAVKCSPDSSAPSARGLLGETINGNYHCGLWWSLGSVFSKKAENSNQVMELVGGGLSWSKVGLGGLRVCISCIQSPV